MTTDATTWHLLPPELIELQLGQIDLLLAMYPEDITIEGGVQSMIDDLRKVIDGESNRAYECPPLVSVLLRFVVPHETQTDKILGLDLIFPFSYKGTHQPEDPPNAKVRVQQPPWLSRAATAQLMDNLPLDEDLLTTIEHIKDSASAHLSHTSTTTSAPNPISTHGPLVRVWFYFPSISTRSKRSDFITSAPTYHLTGFLYAGKPGLLCVEGTSQNIDDYMRWIKTESWGDIPAHHKKVSERYREEGATVKRVFGDMSEITDTVGERRGGRMNRGDMKAVEEWLGERGLGSAFAKVLM